MAGWTKVEEDLAKVVVDDLRERGWTVYQEVTVGSAACDIVAVSGSVIWAIECKIGLGLSVLAQARGWQPLASLVSVAVLPGRASDSRRLAMDTAAMLGVGVLEVYEPGRHWGFPSWGRMAAGGSRVREVARPRRGRVSSSRLRASLRPEQQDFAPAGTADGKRFTVFAGTCVAVRRVLELDGPLTIRDLVRRLDGQHHYASDASARGSLYKWAELGKIDGVELQLQGKGRPAKLGLKPKSA